MFFENKAPTLDVTPEAMHLQMELWVIIFYCLHQTFYDYIRFQFLPYLTLQRFLWALPRFHFTPRKLPAILIIAIPPLRCEDTTFIIMYDCCYDFYLFHISSMPIDFRYS